MVEQLILQTLLTYLTLISVPVGVFYHIMTLRNTGKNQEMQLETRQAQLFMQIYQEMSSPEHYKRSDELLHMEWTTGTTFTENMAQRIIQKPTHYESRCGIGSTVWVYS